jgi:bifunctional DNA-binding transcriptional regulator/antitoxin component of YhaV-PrlF toxin-antitoxin module
MKRNKERMLPSDYTKFLKLDNLQKKLQSAKGFFTLPETVKATAAIKERDFLVFYFDNHDDYLLVRKYFEKHSQVRSHPELKTNKLVRLVKRHGETLKQDM